MTRRNPAHARDPLALNLALTAMFAALASWHLAIPSHPFFDEVHYLPAARALLAGGLYLNQEHPLLGKELVALGIWLLGDNPIGWRAMPLCAGSLALFGAMRAMWFASGSRFASLGFGVLLASGFMLFVLARIAMLDIFSACFAALAAWQFARALRVEQGQTRALALCGLALGAALASKWNVLLVAMLPLSTLVVLALRARWQQNGDAKDKPNAGQISLPKAIVLLGALPLAIYGLSFVPAMFLNSSPLANGDLIAFHRHMVGLQESVIAPHAYQSNWPQWVTNTRSIWLLYEPVDGAWRGIILLGNPLTMLLGVVALVWCAFAAAPSGAAAMPANRRWARLAMVIGYLASLGLWWIAPKPVQFFYHYFTAQFFLLGALALMLDFLRQIGHRRIAYGVLGASAALFLWFYPILGASPLSGKMGFARWMWLSGWI